MPYKSERLFSDIFRFVLAFLFLGFFSCSAFAKITVTPITPWVVVTNNVYYRHYSGAAADGPLMGKDFKSYDFTIKSAEDAAAGYPNTVFFDVQSDNTFSPTSDQRVAVMIHASTDSGDIPIPIIYADGDCPTNCQAQPDPAYYAAARYTPGSIIRIGINIEDICISGTNQGKYPDACDASGFIPPSTSESRSIPLTFYVGIAPDVNSLPATTDADLLELTVNIQGISPSMSGCPTMDNLYFPGDGEISLDANVFTPHTPRNGIAAPLASLVVIGKEDADPNTGTTFSSENPIYSELALGGGAQPVKGFTNTTDGNDKKYNLMFGLRDASGAVSSFVCPLRGVQTSAIQGFLGKSSCFIATAAFRSTDAAPVLLLRELRDKILLKTELGSRFVGWYYHWSPPRAEWLMKNEFFRYPVLLWLFPLQLIAWLILHPLLLLSLIIVSISVLFIGLREKTAAVFFLLLILVIPFSTKASTEEVSVQPYIDELKKDLPEAENPVKQGESYTENIKKKLKTDDQIPDGQYIDVLKESNPEAFEKKSEGSFIEEQKAKLEPVEKTSAISAVSEGKSELKPRYDGPISHAFTVKIGASLTRSITAPGVQLSSFKNLYGENWAPDGMFLYEYQPFHSEWYGNIGFVLGTGLAYYHGKGSFKYNLENPAKPGTYFGSASQTKFQFFTFPLIGGVNYRFNLFRILRPFVQVAGVAMGYLERRDDNKDGNRGYSKGIFVTFGTNINLNWIAPSASWSLYESFGVKKYYLTVDYSRLTTFASDVDFTISGISAGLAYEF